MGLSVSVAPHPLLEVGAFVMKLDSPLVEIATPDAVLAALEAQAIAPICSSDTVRVEVRTLLRHGGFKPAGRSKPSAEYLHAAHQENAFPRINAAVDTCNAVSLHSGLPISLVDVDRLDGALAIAIAPEGTSFAFNPSGQVIDASGLVCLCDAHGPSGTPVKDAQRTKTHDGTCIVLTIVWGTRSLPGRTAKTIAWYRGLAAQLGAIDEVELDYDPGKSPTGDGVE